MSAGATEVAKQIADELADCGVKLVASLPDNWLMGLISALDGDQRFVHVGSIGKNRQSDFAPAPTWVRSDRPQSWAHRVS